VSHRCILLRDVVSAVLARSRFFWSHLFAIFFKAGVGDGECKTYCVQTVLCVHLFFLSLQLVLFLVLAVAVGSSPPPRVPEGIPARFAPMSSASNPEVEGAVSPPVPFPGVARRDQERNYDSDGYIHSVATIDRVFTLRTKNLTYFYTYRQAEEPGKREAEIVTVADHQNLPETVLGHPVMSIIAPPPPKAPPATVVLRVAVYMITLDGWGCGDIANPAACNSPCGASVIRDIFVTGANNGHRNLNAFYRKVSRGRVGLKLDEVDIFSVTIPENTTMLDMPPVVESIIGNKRADRHVYLLPHNYGRDFFEGGNVAALGQLNGPAVWIRACVFSFVVHEIGHTFGLNHAGGHNKDGWEEYYDLTSVMGIGGEAEPGQPTWGVGGYRGLASPQLRQLGWIRDSNLLSITRNGRYTIPHSVSSNSAGVVGARIYVSGKVGTRSLWVEWREAINQDVDLHNAQDLQDAFGLYNKKGPLLGSLLVKDFTDDRRTSLVATLSPGKSITYYGVTITSGAHKAGTGFPFTVTGIGSTAAQRARPNPK
jgi:hypothetical protein